MFRILSIGIDVVSALVFIFPVMLGLYYGFWKQRGLGGFLGILFFALYSMAVFSAVGTPTLYSLHIMTEVNLIPLVDIVNNPASYIENTVLNIILFMPLGILLPILWDNYRSLRKTVLFGLAVSLFIELSQVFTFRLTDIDDLLTNTLGAALGYELAKAFSFRPQLIRRKNPAEKPIVRGKYEPLIILTVVFLIGFFLQPLVSNLVWSVMLSSGRADI